MLRNKLYFIPVTLSHLSTHLAWNSCEQGSTLTICLVSKSLMHTTHTVWPPAPASCSSVPPVSSVPVYLRWTLIMYHSNNRHTEL